MPAAPITRLSSHLLRQAHASASTTNPPSPATSTNPIPHTPSTICPSDSISEYQSDSTTVARSSWVWQYFTQQELEGTLKNICRAKEGFVDNYLSNNDTEDPEAPILICNKSMAIDKTGSTKSMIRHLSRCHHIKPPVNTDQQTIAAFFMDGKLTKVSFYLFEPFDSIHFLHLHYLFRLLSYLFNLSLTYIIRYNCLYIDSTFCFAKIKSLNRANLKDALIRLVVNRELPISLVDAPEFRELLTMINSATPALLSKQTCVSEGILTKYRTVRCALINILSEVKDISITCDGWTSPSNVAMLGVTAHWIDENFKMQNIILALKPIDGPHTGVNLATLLKNILDKFNITDRLYCITADNASNNTTMGQSLTTMIPHFDASQSLHGCVAHVINLVAKSGMVVFDQKTAPPPVNALDPTIPQPTVPLFIESTPHTAMASVLTRIRTLHKKVKHSPQLKASLDSAIQSCSKVKRKVGLVHEVSTRWSSTHASLERFVELRPVIHYVCDGNPTLDAYSLDDSEWVLVETIVKFLSPLAHVIKNIEGHSYPTFSNVMPDYQWLVDRLESVSNFV